MKILLISTNLEETPYPVYPLGMGMVAAALERAGHQIAQFDLLQHEGSLEALAAAARDAAPGLVGLSIRNIDNVNWVNEHRYIGGAREIVRTLRAACSAPIVLGGSGFSLMPEAILAALGADYGVVGEGEALFTAFVADAERGVFPAVPILRSTPSLSGGAIPSACYDPAILAFYNRRGRTAPIQTKRGCTHRCAYCTYPLLEGREVRSRSPRAIVDDMERVVREFGVEQVFFTDSVFNDDAGTYLDILRELKARRLHIPWCAFLKPEPFDEATLDLLLETGLRAVELGSDASTDATLAGLHKSFRFADIVECDRRLADRGVPVAHYYMFGGPGETRATVQEGIRNITALTRAVSFMFMGIRILPGTPLEAVALEKGLLRPGQDLLEPVYYLEPGLDREWLQATLTEGFRGHRRCVFPPDAFERQVRLLHQLGYSGMLWDLLSPVAQGARRARRHSPPAGPAPS